MTKKKKDKVTKNNKVEKYDNEKTIEWVKDIIDKFLGNDHEVRKLGKKLDEIKNFKKEFKDEEHKFLYQIARSRNDETGYALAESVDEDYKGLVYNLKKDIEKEYSCKTKLEKALVDHIINSYIRKLSYSRLIQNYDKPNYIADNHVGLLNFYSKEIDKSHRQFLSALETLRLLKQPEFKVNIKSNNAYISQNQQINSNSKNNGTK